MQITLILLNFCPPDYEVTWDEGSSTMSAVHKLTNAAHEGQVDKNVSIMKGE